MKKVKICGLRRKEDILIVNRLKPDYVGFVFADSSRKVTKEEAKELKNEYLEGQIRASGSEGDDTSHRKIAVQMLSSMYFSTLTPPDILIPKEELKKTFPFA